MELDIFAVEAVPLKFSIALYSRKLSGNQSTHWVRLLSVITQPLAGPADVLIESISYCHKHITANNTPEFLGISDLERFQNEIPVFLYQKIWLQILHPLNVQK